MFQQRRRIPWYTFFNVLICLWPSWRWVVIPLLSVLTSLSYPLPSNVSLDLFLQMTSAEPNRQLVRSNVRKNISGKTKRILMRDISSRVYVAILKDFVQSSMLSSGPKSIIGKAFRVEKLVVTALGSVCSKGSAGHARSPFLPVSPSLWQKPWKFSTTE